jgi:RNA polymerase sigma-70 factor (ECF subfamily)
MLEPSDLELVERAQGGDNAAFEVLVRRYSSRVHAIGLSMMREDAAARDIAQETFLSAWRKLHTFRQQASFRAWLFRIATNACLMRMRYRRRRPEVPLMLRAPGFSDDGEHERPVVDWSPLADKLMEDHELGNRIRDTIAGLPDKYRAVIVLADYQHLSMREIAESLDLTVSNVKTRLHRARLTVREELSEYLAGRS